MEESSRVGFLAGVWRGLNSHVEDWVSLELPPGTLGGLWHGRSPRSKVLAHKKLIRHSRPRSRMKGAAGPQYLPTDQEAVGKHWGQVNIVKRQLFLFFFFTFYHCSQRRFWKGRKQPPVLPSPVYWRGRKGEEAPRSPAACVGPAPRGDPLRFPARRPDSRRAGVYLSQNWCRGRRRSAFSPRPALHTWGRAAEPHGGGGHTRASPASEPAARL